MREAFSSASSAIANALNRIESSKNVVCVCRARIESAMKIDRLYTHARVANFHIINVVEHWEGGTIGPSVAA